VIAEQVHPSQAASRVSVAMPDGRFKDFQMTQALLTRQSFMIAIMGAVQALMPAVIAVSSFYVTALFFGDRFDPSSPAVVIVALLSWLFFQPSRRRRSPLIPARVSALASVMLRWLSVLGVLLFIYQAVPESPLQEYPRHVYFAWSIATTAGLMLASLTLQEIKRRFLIHAFDGRSAIVAGYSAGGLKLARQLKRNPNMRIGVAGFFDDRSEVLLNADRDARILGKLRDVAEYVKTHRTDVIFVALPNRDVQSVMTLMDDLRDTTASIYYVPDCLAFDRIQPRSDQIQGIPVIAMCESPFYGFRGVGKRWTDVGFAALALLLLSPLMLLIAVSIKLTSRGPVIQRQRRYGLDGREITIYRFRTRMLAKAGAELGSENPGSGPLTNLGRGLRGSSLDGLPQFVNVLQGRMSLVGPQPHTIAHSEQYRKYIKGYMIRYKVAPGLTGLARINGCAGETDNPMDMQARVNLDLDYLRHWSPLLDVKILVVTLAQCFGRESPPHRNLDPARMVTSAE
jgi:putative colanic acid biosynthesis UDP-glucose lipid carrier transferase